MTRGLRSSAVLSFALVYALYADAAGGEPTLTKVRHVVRHDARLPMSFTPNEGQYAAGVAFVASGSDYSVALTRSEADLSLRRGFSRRTRTQRDSILRMQLLGAAGTPILSGSDPLPGKANFLIGNDPAKWRTNIATFARVKYAQVYPGVDLVYYGNQRHLEFDFNLKPGADPAAVRLGFRGELAGARLRLKVDHSGNLIVDGPAGGVLLPKPLIYQQLDGKRQLVRGGYVVTNGRQLSFRLGSYDKAREVVIDPTLTYSTLLGGEEDDEATAIAVNPAGEVFVTGYTNSMHFPTTAGAISRSARYSTAFVTRLNAEGSAVLYSTYLGGAQGGNTTVGIAVDAAGNAFVAGFTDASDYPTTPGAFQSKLSGNTAAFLSKLNPTGSAFVYSTLFGGTVASVASALAIDSGGSAYVTGYTLSPDFPTTPGVVQTDPGSSAGRVQDAFLTKFNPAGTALVYSTLLGETDTGGTGLAVDKQGDVYLTGTTNYQDFPVTHGAFSSTGEGFITKFNATATALLYSTRLQGSAVPSAIAIDSVGDAYITGDTGSDDLPVTPHAFQTAVCHRCDTAFVLKLNPSGSALLYSTYLGEGGAGNSIALDASGNAYVTGVTGSATFPTTSDALQPVYGGGTQDAFLTRVNVTGSALLYSSFLGGNALDTGSSVTLDPRGNVYVAGFTFVPHPGATSTFQTTRGSFQPGFAGGTADAFISKFDFLASACSANVQLLVDLDRYRVNEDNFTLTGVFAPAPAGSFNPLTQPVTLSIGANVFAIPVGSFVKQGAGFAYHGELDGQPVAITIQALPESANSGNDACTAGGYKVFALIRSANLGTVTNPVPVSVGLGESAVTTTVQAQIFSRHYE